MADQRPFDFAELFSEFITQAERDIDALANRLMGTEQYSRSMNEVQRVQTRLSKSFSDFMGEQLASFNMPSRDDVVRLGETLHGLDARIARVERQLQDLARSSTDGPAAPTVSGPPRTKQPPSRSRVTSDAAPNGEERS